MPQLSDLLQQGAGHAWLFIPTAILLGALHGLEPGHSKTMMAAFIIAVRGTVTQAVQLGVSAALSHTAVVWAVALVGLTYGARFNAEASEPYFQVASAGIIIVIALWMLWRTWRDLKGSHRHDHHHDHDEAQRIAVTDGIAVLSIHEVDAPPHFRLQLETSAPRAKRPRLERASLETVRPDGAVQRFTFGVRDAIAESMEAIPEPHTFKVRLTLDNDGMPVTYEADFAEHDHGGHGAEAMDAHARAHAKDITGRFRGGSVTTRQIILFGLTGGLIPCPAAITVLLVCLQLKHVSLGVTLVLAFSVGLAMTMVGAGVVAALSLKHARQRWSGFDDVLHYAPFVSCVLILAMGLYLGNLGWSQIAHS
jgi:nickel/cobalt exporter